MSKLKGKRVAFLVADGVEQIELVEPWEAVEENGGHPEMISIQRGPIQAFNHLDHGDKFTATRSVAEADVDDYDALVIPGGVASPDALRADSRIVQLVQEFAEAGKPIAAICHGPWLLVEADVLHGRRLTSFGSIRTDILNAGGGWLDEEIVVDDGLVTSRSPDDLPAFCDKMIEEICEGVHADAVV